ISSDQSLSGIPEDAPASPNGNGCSSVPNNCDALCLKIDASGCIICTCSGTEANKSSSGLSTSSLTGSVIKLPHSVSMNLNGCPPFPAGCSGDCASLDSDGCAICKCPVSGGSGGSTGGSVNSTSISVVAVDNGYNHVDSGAMNNGNGCPPYSKDCQAECAAIDEHGCVVCQCTSSGSGNSGGSDNSTSVSVGGGGVVNAYNHISSGAMNNGNGCPAYSKDCPGECAAIDDNGCVVCRCTISGTPVANGTSSTGAGGDNTNNAYHNEYNHLAPGSTNNNNNCPQFSESCPAECTTTNDDGCPVCSCISSGNIGGGSTSGGSASATSVNECPVFDSSCPITCITTDRKQCLICTCSNIDTTTTIHKTTPAPTVTTTTTSPVTSACPVFDTSCPHECTSLDEMQCLTCTCADITTTPAPTVQTTMVPAVTSACPVFDTSCPPACISLDEMQCLQCTCAGCAPFDASCPSVCVAMDAKGCLQCKCPLTQVGLGNGCPPFDANCDPACITINVQGCMTCTCAATSSQSVPITEIPSITNTTAAASATCPPLRCVSPCDVGITFGADKCPICKCQTVTTKSP
ncbi:hypothetical protein ACJMK2_026469, partial [Sinanodonta woodiana]